METTLAYTAVAGEDLRDKQYHFVKLSLTEDNTVINVTSMGSYGVGVLMNAPNIGQAATIAIFGIVKIKVAMGGVTRGTTTVCDNLGRVSGASASGMPHYFMVLENGAENDLVRCKLLTGLNVL